MWKEAVMKTSCGKALFVGATQDFGSSRVHGAGGTARRGSIDLEQRESVAMLEDRGPGEAAVRIADVVEA